MAETHSKENQDKSTQRLITTLKTMGTTTQSKDLTEEQKQAFQALMRMAADPSGYQWERRVKQMQFVAARKERSAQLERHNNQQQQHSQPQSEHHTKTKLKHRVAEMRRLGKFPLPPDKTTPKDNARRYGFIPKSERRKHPTDYAKV
ncbi:uncharacterized protein LOC128742431 isoform X2 [Sabethes cyaneus]|uniref:uncharacterized protein LOC128742431 isoform X2 n=1 Tax=Sabethes cyaneus TaxID=53552 RepID=UPI00237DEBA9|nr:uncharacterized protein LOC128742431 isoform X2 [Sabethes cyaneus]